MYSGYTFPIPLPSEKSEQIAMCLENNLFKSFGIPEELSSDNASNLAAPPPSSWKVLSTAPVYTVNTNLFQGKQYSTVTGVHSVKEYRA